MRTATMNLALDCDVRVEIADREWILHEAKEA